MTGAAALCVVVPVYGPGPHLDTLVTALRAQIPPVAGIVLSHSGTGEPTGRFTGRDITVLHTPVRLFAGAARNRGVEHAATDWIGFVDEDVIVGDGWHQAILDAIAQGGADCIVGSLGHDARGGYWGMVVWFIEFGSVHPYRAAGPIGAGGSGNMAVRRAPFVAIGGFPEDRQRGEDSLAQARLRAAGSTIRFEPKAIGRHVNLPGFRRMLRHMYAHGVAAAKLRRDYPGLRGAAAVRWPVLSLGLWLARLCQIHVRVLRARGGPVGTLLLHTPGILVGLLAWNAGFAREALIGGGGG